MGRGEVGSLQLVKLQHMAAHSHADFVHERERGLVERQRLTRAHQHLSGTHPRPEKYNRSCRCLLFKVSRRLDESASAFNARISMTRAPFAG